MAMTLMVISCGKPVKKKIKPKVIVSEELYQLTTSKTSDTILEESVVFKVVGSEGTIRPPEKVDDDGGYMVISPKAFSIGGKKDVVTKSKVVEKVQTQFQTPVSSFASLLVDAENNYQWQPKKRAIRQTYGAPWISTQALSDDKSVFAIVEVMGQEGGANGSRLVLLNTFNSEILRILSFDVDLITHLAFDEENKRIVTIVKEQDNAKRKSAIVVYDLLTGKEKKRIKLNSNLASCVFQYATKQNKLFLTFPDEGQLWIYDLKKSDLKKMPFPEKSCFSLDIEADAFIIANSKDIVSYSIDSLNKVSLHQNPLNEVLTALVMIDDEHYLASTESSKLYACTLQNPTSALICDKVSGSFFFSAQFKKLFVHMEKGDLITQWEGTPWRKISELNIRKINPSNSYQLRFFDYIPAGERVLAFDSQANVLFCAKPKLEWAKKIVIMSK